MNTGTVHGIMILDDEDVESLLDMKEVLKAVESAFEEYARGEALMPPKLYLDLSSRLQGDFRAMPAFVNGACGVKWVSVYPRNPSKGLRTVQASIIYSDPETGCTLAFMDGTAITDMRTGASGGIAAKYLARRNSKVVGLIGGGRQSRTQLQAIREVLPALEEVKLCEPRTERRDAAAALARQMAAETGLDIRDVECIEDAAEADIVVTTTPSRTPLLKDGWIRPGTHINAIGADAPGKQELDPALLMRAKIVVDDLAQARHSGEINVPLARGELELDAVYGNLGSIVAGMKQGRVSDDDITVFDSTGLAIQDMATAKIVYDKALASSRSDPKFQHLRS